MPVGVNRCQWGQTSVKSEKTFSLEKKLVSWRIKESNFFLICWFFAKVQESKIEVCFIWFVGMISKQKAERSTQAVKNENDADADKNQIFDKSVSRLIHFYSYFFWSLVSDVKLELASTLRIVLSQLFFNKMVSLLATIFPQFSDF